MNRLSPLISRRTGPYAIALPYEDEAPFDFATPAAWLDDLRLFAAGWLGGLVFFGTLFG